MGSTMFPEPQTALQKQLFTLQDCPYRDFQARLIPTIDKATIIGVRMPALRKLARSFGKTPEAAGFLTRLPHRYYEENILHGCLIAAIPDYPSCLEAVDNFLPFVDNWAVCDTFKPRVFKKHRAELKAVIPQWIASDRPYTVRFGVGMLMNFFLDDAFDPQTLDWVSAIVSEEYYVNMMVAWYFATALAKQPEATLPVITGRRLPVWTHNKAIQKAIESRRISPEQKTFLRTLKIPKK